MGKTTKVVVDTNVLISAVGWGGKPKTVVAMAVNREITLYTSPAIIDEAWQVVNRLSFNASNRQELLSILTEVAVLVRPMERIRVVEDDPADDMLLECAVEAQADYLITGDNHLLTLNEFSGIKIVTPAKFLRIFR